MKSFHGHFGVIVRAYAYIRLHGADGLREVSEDAVLNANYLLALLRDTYHVPYDRVCMHEFVVEGRWAERAPRDTRARYFETIDGFWFSPTHQLLPAHRPRNP